MDNFNFKVSKFKAGEIIILKLCLVAIAIAYVFGGQTYLPIVIRSLQAVGGFFLASLMLKIVETVFSYGDIGKLSKISEELRTLESLKETLTTDVNLLTERFKKGKDETEKMANAIEIAKKEYQSISAKAEQAKKVYNLRSNIQNKHDAEVKRDKELAEQAKNNQNQGNRQ